jgi:dienelactone hydrolase
MKTMAWLLCGLLALPSAAPSCAAPVQLPSLDAPAGRPVVLNGHWFEAPGTTAAPAMVLMHGCSGFLDRRGQLAKRYTEMARKLNSLGVHVLLTDSFGPRGERQICTQATGQRRITQAQRRLDALGALAWVAVQPGVDRQRLGLLGWSNGGSAVLAASNKRQRDVAAAAVQPSLVVAFYPGCETELARGYEPSAALLLLLGEADDWTPAAPCKALAASVTADAPAVQWQAYPGAYHGFDGAGPVRLRKDVPNGVNPGQGVHVGGQPAARAAAHARLEAFLRHHWRLAP